MNDRLPALCRIQVISLAVATAALAGEAPERAADEINIAGEYTCRGGNPDGGAYVGKVVITKTGQTYTVQWTIGSGQVHAGIAIREGNVLSVCFVAGGGAGVASYKIEKTEDGPRLVGRWAGLGGQKTQPETLTKGAPPPRKNNRSPRRMTRALPKLPAQAT